MSDVVIRAEGLGKKYMIGHQAQAERYTALRDVVARTAKRVARSARDMMRGRQLIVGDEVEEFWALKDVNFEIRRGEVVGIIGRNGAGKSTLLKILSRITEPSTGRVEIRGRVASLLEVGTGFHPELSGRENIFLNGAILGMTRAEIKRKFDDIVAFAEVEKFLDTPVKHYSSGMYVRLAFAVAAHLEPEILVIDEVLAVGDAEFQKKCLGKMDEVARHGRTVLFVTHNTGAVGTLCKRGFLLKNGKVIVDGTTHEIMNVYLSATSQRRCYINEEPRVGPAVVKATLVQFGRNVGQVINNAPFWIVVELAPPTPPNLAVSIHVNRVDGICCHHVGDEFTTPVISGTHRVCIFPEHSLMIGRYSLGITIHLRNVEIFHAVEDALQFDVIAVPEDALLLSAPWKGITSPRFASWLSEEQL